MDPQNIESKEFLVSLRGYDRDEVDAFLREVAQELRNLRAKREGAGDVPPTQSQEASDYLKSIGEKVSDILMEAEKAATVMRQEADHDSKRAIAEATEQATKTVAEAEQRASTTVDKADEEAKRTVADARDEAARTVASARQEAAKLLAKAREDENAIRQEIAQLTETRNALATQLEDVGQRLNENVARLHMPLTPEQDLPVTPKQDLPVTPKQDLPVTPEQDLPVTPEQDLPVTPEQDLQAASTTPTIEERTEEEPPREPAEQLPEGETDKAPEPQGLQEVLEEVRKDREEGRAEVEAALESVSETPDYEPAQTAEEVDPQASAALETRAEALADLPRTSASKLKRLLQEDQNELLDRMRTFKGKGGYASLSDGSEQAKLFKDGLEALLRDSYEAGRKVAGADSGGVDAAAVSSRFVDRQLLGPLRKELTATVDVAIDAGDTPTAISEKASDIYRVWKSVRAEMLGEGLAYAVFHNGLLSGWEAVDQKTKAWVFSPEEGECTNGACTENASAGSIGVKDPFPSGHSAPPAHGGCSCTMVSDDG